MATAVNANVMQSQVGPPGARQILPLPRSRLRSSKPAGAPAESESDPVKGISENRSSETSQGQNKFLTQSPFAPVFDTVESEEDDLHCENHEYCEWADNSGNSKKRKVPTNLTRNAPGDTSKDTSHSTRISPNAKLRLRRFSHSLRSSFPRDKDSRRRVKQVNLAGDATNSPSQKSEPGLVYSDQTCDSESSETLEPPQGSFEFSCDSAITKAYQSRVEPLFGRSLSNEPYKAISTNTMVPPMQDVPPPPANPPIPPAALPPKKPKDAKTRQVLRRRKHLRSIVNAPASEELWVCQICEFESLFGGVPELLMRRVDAKERKELKAASERRRLLEKAKAKARKHAGRMNEKAAGPVSGHHAKDRGAHAGDSGPCPDCGGDHSQDYLHDDPGEDDDYEYEQGGLDDGSDVDCDCRCCYCHRRLHDQNESSEGSSDGRKQITW